MSIVNQKEKTLLIAQLGILTALEIVIAFTPLGSIPMFGIVATLAHVPVIIAAVVLGKRAGLYMGFVFGLLSFIVWTMMPPNPVLAFLFTPFYSAGEIQGNFWSVVICFVPRILIGLFSAITFQALYKKTKTVVFSAIVAAIVGTLTNTILVLSGVYLFFGNVAMLEAAGKTIYYFIYLNGGLNGLLETIIAVILIPTIAKILKLAKVMK